MLRTSLSGIVVALLVALAMVDTASARNYWRCECGYTTRDEGPMNNVDTFEPLVDAIRSAGHAYDCEVAQAANLRRVAVEEAAVVRSRSREVVQVAGVFDLFVRSRSRSSVCVGGNCKVQPRAPSAVKPLPTPTKPLRVLIVPMKPDPVK